MEDPVARIAEEKIRDAMARGEFDNLPGAGKPLELEDLSQVPEELHVAFLALKNAGFLPQEAQLRKEMAELAAALAATQDEDERTALRAKLQDKNLQYTYLTERWTKKPRPPRKSRLQR